jgi:hypothetical protein
MNTNLREKIKWLRSAKACEDALKWLEDQQSWEQAWQDCERGDWMLWLLGYLSGEPGSRSRRKLVAASARCARLAWKWRCDNRGFVNCCC